MNLALSSEASVEQFGDYPQLVGPTRTWSSSETLAANRRLAGALIDLGVARGDRVITFVPNRPETVILYLAIWRAGATCVPVLPRLTPSELASRIAHSGARVLFTTAELHARVAEAIGQLAAGSRVPTIVLLDAPGSADVLAFDDLVRTGREIVDPIDNDPDALALLMYTGGTTGAPKGTMITHRGLDGTSLFLSHGLPRPVCLLVIPLAHIAGICWGLGYFRYGGKLVLLDTFDGGAVLQAIADHRVEVFPGAPWLFWSLATRPDVARYDTSSMKLWIYASAAMPQHQIDAFEATFSTRLHTAYGLTECSGASTKTLAEHPRKPGSVGRVGGPHQLRVVDDAGQPIAPGQVGEIAIGGSAVSPGYLGLPEETAATFRDGWLFTGDLGSVDEDGDVFLAGRKKELIITAGFNVYPAEIEGVIADLPGVHSVSVIGVEDAELGERSLAFVATVQGSGLTRDAIVRHCVRKLASYKVPSIYLLDKLPVMDTGKVDKRRLRELARDAKPRAGRRARPTRQLPHPTTPPVKLAEWESAIGALVDVQRRIEARIRVLLDIAPETRVALDQPLMELGLDSLRAVQLRDDLAQELGPVELSSTLAFDHPTIAALSEHIFEQLAGLEATRPEKPTPPPDARPIASEPIAIVGMGVRLPGGIETLDDYWALLRQGRDGTGPVPADRWDPAEYADPAMARGGFVDDLAGFDASLFGINSAEAASMDPQQRWLLEVSWRALEHAGIAPDRLKGTRTGVIVGITTDEYAYLGDIKRDVAYGGGTGALPSVAAGRLAYLWDLQGPCYVVDTACSSSLVAIHQAVRALQAGEADLVLAGGVNAIVTARYQAALASVGALAPDGRSKTFDERADGFCRSEGCAMVCLKRLSDAERDGDNVLAVLLGTSINHDGRASALTAPNGKAQEQLLRDCLTRAGVRGGEVDYVEAHGTGTKLGDPIEVGALVRAYGRSPDRTRELFVGSVKSNIGHTESAAGATGLVKVVLMLQRGEIAPTIHFEQLNPHIPLQGSGVAIANRTIPWRARQGRRRIAGVNAFGISGTNSHALLAEAPQRPRPQPSTHRACHVAIVSAKTPSARAQLAQRYAAFLRERPSVELADFCITLARGRARLDSTAAVIGDDRAALVDALAALARGDDSTNIVERETPVASRRVAFVFTGQGAQYPRMGKELFDAEPVFQAAIRRCALGLAGVLEHSLIEAMFGADSEALLALPTYAQPAQFAISYGLAELWRSWGVVPQAVIGHSFGEYAAAVVAGVLQLEDALALVAARGRIVDEMQPGGAMYAISASRAEVSAVLGELGGRLGIAAVNAPDQIVISGPTDELDRAVQRFAALGRDAKHVRVPHAFHSPMMAAVAERFHQIAAPLSYAAPRIPFLATLEGRFLAPGEVPDAAYWSSGLVRTVQWSESFQQLVASGFDVLVEVSSHPVLLAMAPRILPDAALELVPSLRRDREGAHPDRRTIATAAARLALAGIDIDWKAYERVARPARVEAPTYPFEHQRYWIEVSEGAPVAARPAHPAHPAHPLLGVPTREGDATVFETAIDLATLPWLGDHRVAGAPVFPGTGYIEQLLAAASRTNGSTELRAVAFERPLLLGEGGRVVQVRLDGASAEIASRGDGEWTVHVRAELGARSARAAAPKAEAGDELSTSDLYRRLARIGLEYGPAFQGLRRAWRMRDGRGAIGEIELPATDGGYVAHPALVDACFHLAFLALPGELAEALVPVRIDRVALLGTLTSRLRAQVSIVSIDATSVALDLVAHDATGAAVFEMTGAQFRRIDGRTFVAQRSLADVCFEVAWVPRSLAHQRYDARPSVLAPIPEDVLVHLDATAMSARAAAQLDGDAARELDAGLCALARYYILRALRELGWKPTQPTGAAVRLAQKLGVIHTHRRLFERLLGLLAETGGVPTEPVGELVDPGELPVDVERLRAATPNAGPLLGLFQRCGEALAGVLAGKVDPLSVVFADWDELAAIYERDPLCNLCNDLLAGAVEAAIATAPAGRTVRILEVGGGTGGTTVHVLRRLAQRTGRAIEYVFTDLSDGFLTTARRRFAEHAGFSTRLFDLERDPVEQGFSPGYFDVILEANAIHATRDLRATLTRLRQLAAPGALLALSETLERCAFVDLTFGLTHGWWLFSDRDLRDHALIDETKWGAVLAATGFEQIEVFPREAAARRGPAYRQGVVLCRATGEAAASEHAMPTPRVSGTWLVVADDGGALVDHLRRAGATVTTSHRDDVTHVVYARAAVEPLLELARTLAERERVMLWIVTRGGLDGEAAALWGIGRVISNELPELTCKRVDLATTLDTDRAAAMLVAELAGGGDEDEIALAPDGRRASRLVRWQPAALGIDDNVQLVADAFGSFDALALRGAPRAEPAAGQVEIEIEAAGINFHDVLKVLGVMQVQERRLGGECAGRIVRVGPDVADLAVGDRVVSFEPGSYARFQLADARRVVRVPDKLATREAATIPQAFLAAHHALVTLGTLARGQRVLIHAAAGGVGQAAVQLALAAGAEVFATASTAKHALVRALGVAHVLDSRSPSFADEIRRITGGEGVDLALCSVAGELARATAAIVRPGGTFVELGLADRPAELPDSVRWASFRMDELQRDEPAPVRALLRDLLERVATGELRPLPSTMAPLADAAAVFGAMAQGRHTGKLLLVPPPAAPRVFRTDGTYLVTGGLGGIGPALAGWLCSRGAGAVVLVGRRAPDAATRAQIDELVAAGHRVSLELADVLDPASLASLVARLPSIAGVVHAVGVVDDAPLAEQTPERFARVLAPKVTGAWNLRRALAGTPLDFFALFGSLSSVVGVPGQANHAAANATLDALAHAWSAEGLPTLSISWGAWDRIGYAARANALPHLARRGIRPLAPELAFAALERGLAERARHLVVTVFDWPRLFAAFPALGGRFAAWRPATTIAASPPAPALVAAPVTRVAVPDVAERLVASVVEILGVAPKLVDLDRPLAELGLDSLVVVELRNRWRRQLGCELPADWPSRFPTLRAVAATIAPPAAAATVTVAAPAVDTSAIADRLVASVVEILGVTPKLVDLDRPLAELGLDSLVVVELRNRWRRQLRAELPADWPTRFASLRAVAAHLAPTTAPAPTPAPVAPPARPRLVPLATPSPIVCVHPAGGSVGMYGELARRLAAAGLSVIGIEYATQVDRAFTKLEDLARTYVELLRADVPRGPYRLVGWSVGGAIAHAMAAELERTGADVELLCVVDPPSALHGETIAPLELLASSFGGDLHGTLLNGGPDRLRSIAALPSRDLRAMATEVAATAFDSGLLRAPLVVESAAEQMILVGSHLELARRYRPRPVHAPLVAVVPTQRAASDHERWTEWSDGRQTVCRIEGDHFSIMQGPGLESWGDTIVDALAPPTHRPPDLARLDRWKRPTKGQHG